MRYSQSEKMEVIRLVESSPLSIKQTLCELNINRSTFYDWYRRYQQYCYDGLANRYQPSKQFRNEIPPWEKQKVIETALELPEKSPRELARHITDKQGNDLPPLNEANFCSMYRSRKASLRHQPKTGLNCLLFLMKCEEDILSRGCHNLCCNHNEI